MTEDTSSSTSPQGSLQGVDARPELRIDDLRKRYGQTRALDGLSLRARAGEVIGVAGPNGAGKSTLVRVLAGEEVEDEGEMELGGRPFDLARRRSEVAVVHQEPQLFPTLTVAENLVVGVEGTRFSRPRTQSAQRELLESLGVAHLLRTPVQECSLVAQQLVEIARAVLRDANVFLFDEPNSALTIEESARLFDHIRALREQARCIVMLVTHRLADLVELCDRVAVVRDGSVAGVLSGGELSTANLGQGIAGTWSADGRADSASGREDAALDVGAAGEASAACPAAKAGAAGAASSPAQPRLRARDLARRHLAERALDGAPVLLRASGWSDVKSGAFSEIDLEVRAGEALVITGQEASGGRELVRSLAGLYRARGTLEVDGAHSAAARRAAVSYVPANRAVALFQNFSVAANLAGRLGRGEIANPFGLLSVSRVVARSDELVERLSVRTASSRISITSLSGGNQQKVSVGAALAAGPRVLLVEEPTRGVDVATKQEIYRSLREYLEQGNAMIAFSPEVEDLFHLGDTGRVMVAGRLSRSIALSQVERLDELARQVDALAAGETELEPAR